MSKKESRKNKGKLPTPRLSRREFLNRLGIGAGGALLGSVSIASACKSSVSDTAKTEPNTSSVNTSVTAVQSTIYPSNSSAAPENTTDTPSSITSPFPSIYYTTPNEQPKVLSVPGSECTVATDRLYSENHIWVKSIPTDKVVLGITPSLITIVSRPYALAIPQPGLSVDQNKPFGNIEGQKVNTDLISPVTGDVIQVNETVVRQGMGQGEYMPSVNSDPWVSGWMIVVQLVKPNEIKQLLSPQEYLELLIGLHKG